MVDSVLATGIAGVQTGIANARQAAEDIVSATVGTAEANSSDDVQAPVVSTTVDITEAAMALNASEVQVKASVAVIETADEILGTVLDINA